MSILTIVDNDLLKNEIKALNNYTNRDKYNLNVVEVMVNEIQDIVKGLKPCEKTDSPTECPKCHSTKVTALYGTMNCRGGRIIHHYICNDCNEEFDV